MTLPRNAGEGSWVTIASLGITQITAWGSIYYVFALVMETLQAELRASKLVVVGAFSVSLLIAGLLSPFAGRWIDRHGGRALMTSGSVLAAFGLWALSRVQNVVELYVVWALLGAAMAATLYDPAFAVLTRAFATNYRRAIGALTLFGGFASTVFWPLTQVLIERYGWRDSLAMLALLNLVLCAPLHAFALPKRAAATPASPSPSGTARGRELKDILRDRTFYLLCAAFTGNALVFSAMAVHMLPMLMDKGFSALEAAAIGALVGPMQVLGRIVEMSVGQRFRSSHVGLAAMAMLPTSLVLFQWLGPSGGAYVAFALLYGAGNGVMTIVRGAIPVEFYGRDHYGAVNGALALPVLLAKASGPVVAAVLWLALASYGAVALALAALAAFGAVFFLAAHRARQAEAVGAVGARSL